MGKSRILARKRGSERKHEIERVRPSLKEGGLQGGEEGQTEGDSLRKVCENISGRVDTKRTWKLGFTLCLAKP